MSPAYHPLFQLGPDPTPDRKLTAEGRKWGVIWTNYDCLAAFSIPMYREVGGWDTVFPAYFSDNDWWRRIRLAGYEIIESGLPVDHEGSAAIHSDPERLFMNSQTFPLYQKYFEAKWGGVPGQERFTKAFNR